MGDYKRNIDGIFEANEKSKRKEKEAINFIKNNLNELKVLVEQLKGRS